MARGSEEEVREEKEKEMKNKKIIIVYINFVKRRKKGRKTVTIFCV